MIDNSHNNYRNNRKLDVNNSDRFNSNYNKRLIINSNSVFTINTFLSNVKNNLSSGLYINKFLFFSVLLIFLAGSASAAYSTSTFGSSTSSSLSNQYRYQGGFDTYYSQSDINTYWPILGNDGAQCEARQDILLSIAPAGCTPRVVRSDLLAEQNVPVFCQIDALQVNPLIDIKQIKNIRFSGKYPEGVVGTGFHPARAALNTRDKLLGDPIINNIGYVVVVLKKQPEESKLPESISVNLSAQIDYYSQNAFGVGRNEFILKPTSDADWANERNKNGFWKGQYFVRLEQADQNKAVVSLYYGDKKISTTSVERGKQSTQPIYLPGLFCRAGVYVAYTGFVGAKETARVEVTTGSETTAQDVYVGSRFMGDACTVSKIDIIRDNAGDSDDGTLEFSCSGNSGRFKLGIEGRDSINYEEWAKRDLGVGSAQFGTENDKDKGVIYYADFVSGSSGSYNGKYGVDVGSNLLVKNSDGKWVSSSDDKLKNILISYKNSLLVGNANVKLNPEQIATTELKDEVLGDSDAETAFNNAIKEYMAVADDYSSEQSQTNDGIGSYGESALEEALKLAEGVKGKEKTKKDILERLVKEYPDSLGALENEQKLEKLVSYDLSGSSAVVVNQNRDSVVRVVSFNNVSLDDRSGAVFSIVGFSGKTGVVKEGQTLTGKEFLFGKGTIDSITLRDVVDENNVRVEARCLNSNVNSRTSTTYSDSVYLTLGQDAQELCGDKIRVEDIQINEYAKIQLLPFNGKTGTETNLSVSVGIEKRAIKLNPEKSLERIANLNKSIERWDAISKKLSNVVSGLKGACFATAAVLNVKNFIGGLDGSAIARQQAMKGPDGWTEKCKQMIADGKYSTPTQCFNDNKEAIEKEVNARKDAIKSSNELIQNIESAPGVSTGDSGLLGSGKVVDDDLAKKGLCEKLISNPDFKKTFGDCEDKTLQAISYEDLRDWNYNKILEGKGVAGASNNTKEIEANFKKTKTDLAQIDASKGLSIFDGPSVNAKGSLGVFDADFAKVENLGGTWKIGGKTVKGVSDFDTARETLATVVSDVKGQDARGNNIIGDNKYVVTGYKNSAGNFESIAVYPLTYTNGVANLGNKVDGNSADFLVKTARVSTLRDAGASLSGNQIKDDNSKVVRYFGSGPDKDMPAQVPLDLLNGWYVKVKSGLGENKAYDGSGLPKAWTICNVGEDGKIDSKDDCQSVYRESRGANILGLSDSQSQKLVSSSERALLDAAEQRGNPTVKIISPDGRQQSIKQGNPVSHFNGVECQEFMSPDDCKILFNMCDPVICPATRCNLGGNYQVADVIQTGIVGSALLCLPNAKEGVVIPVCLTGIQAGIDSYVSILKSHRDCLQESVDSGQLVGICDEIYSIYACEFFWNQVAPAANVILPKLVESAYGGAAPRGGGEYLSVQESWKNTQNSIDYFKQQYAVNSLQAFNIRSTEDVGGQFCKAFVGIRGPKTFKSLVAPDSPPQFYAWFSTHKFTDVTVPATAQYKVFYHIFAGKDAGVTYSVYLKNPPESVLYSTRQTVIVKTAFISRGESADETIDFTAPEGYQELCVRINEKEECGFGQVSTDFAVNVLRDKLAQDELTKQNIKTEQECIAGSLSAGNLLNPNIQSGVENTINPDISSRGIVRICASINPGATTEPTRYADVGYCDDNKLRCWLDKNSVDNAITDANLGAKNQTITALEKSQEQALQSEGYLVGSDLLQKIREFADKVRNIVERTVQGSPETAAVQTRSDMEVQFGISNEKIIYNNQKAQVSFMKSQLTGVVAEEKLRNLNLAELEARRVITPGQETAQTTMGNTDKTGDTFVKIPGKKSYQINKLTASANGQSYEISEGKSLTVKTGEIFDLTVEHGCDSIGVEIFEGLGVLEGFTGEKSPYSTGGISISNTQESHRIAVTCYDANEKIKKIKSYVVYVVGVGMSGISGENAVA